MDRLSACGGDSQSLGRLLRLLVVHHPSIEPAMAAVSREIAQGVACAGTVRLAPREETSKCGSAMWLCRAE